MHVRIPLDEIEVRATRSGGPGGQHVNTASTRVEVRWSVAESRALTDAQRERLMSKLGHRLDARGRMRVTSSARRSQHQNRQTAIARLQEIVNQALERPKPRKKSRPSRAAVEARLNEKRRRAERKQRRRPVRDED